MTTFTPQDIDTLIQGLDAIKKAELREDFQHMLIGGLLDNSKDPEEYGKKIEREMKAKEMERAERDESLVLLKAKLIQVKRESRDEGARLIVEQALRED